LSIIKLIVRSFELHLSENHADPEFLMLYLKDQIPRFGPKRSTANYQPGLSSLGNVKPFHRSAWRAESVANRPAKCARVCRPFRLAGKKRKLSLSAQANGEIAQQSRAQRTISTDIRRRHWEHPRTPLRREGTRFQLPCRLLGIDQHRLHTRESGKRMNIIPQ
jgi:hypothetical protein